MIWATLLLSLLYITGISLTLCAVLLLLIRVVTWIRRTRPPEWLRGLLQGPGELIPILVSVMLLFVTGMADQARSTWEMIREAAVIAALVDVTFLVPFIIYIFFFELPREIYAAIRHSHFFCRLISVLLPITYIALAVLGIMSLLGSIARWSPAANEWMEVHVPAWIILFAGWVDTGILLASAVTVFALVSIALLALLILTIGLIDTLFFGRPQETSPLRWLHAPWNDGEEDEEVEGARTDSSFSIVRPDRIMAALIGAVTGGGRESPVFRGTVRQARKIAIQREQFLREHLNTYRNSLPELEIIEVPPVLAESYERRVLSPSSANARLVVLLHQRFEESSLLWGRVLDAIRCFAHSSSPDRLGAEIVLRRLRWWERWPGEYPWVVLVRTEHTLEFVRFLVPLRNWLGIGVRISRPVGWAVQRTCAHSNELGTVAGYLRARGADLKYALTCAHVLPDQCTHCRITREPRSEAAQPDAALLRHHACVDDLREGVRARFVSKRALARIWAKKTPIRRAGGYSTRVFGYVKHREGAYIADDGTIEEFPACVVETRRFRYAWGLLPTPFLRRRFSQTGDSGSWVMVDRTASDAPLWLGMVVAGGAQDNKMETYAIKASALLLYFRRRLPNERPLVPHITEEF